MLTDRVQIELHATARGEVDHDNTRYTVCMQPHTSHHNQLVTGHMCRVRVSETKHLFQQILNVILLRRNSGCNLIVGGFDEQQTWEQEGASPLFFPSRSPSPSALMRLCPPVALLFCPVLQTPPRLPDMNMLSGNAEPRVLPHPLASVNKKQDMHTLGLMQEPLLL